MLRSLAEKLMVSATRRGTVGQILSVKGTVVCGWVEGRRNSLDIKITVNGRSMRPLNVSFTEVASQSGRFNFEAHLSDAPLVNDNVRVCLAGERTELAGSPWLVRANPKTDFEYAFLHIPKTAGTSLRFSLERALGSSAVFPSQDYLTRRGGGYPNYPELAAITHGLSDELKFLQGHLLLPQVEILAPDARIIAVFREPVERVISLIKHRLAESGDQAISEAEISERFFLNPLAGGFANGQIRALLGRPEMENSPSQILQLATAKLVSIEFLGVSDNYIELLETIGNAAGVSLHYECLNRSRLPDRQFSAAFIDKVRELNHLDIKFYENVLSEVALRAAQ